MTDSIAIPQDKPMVNIYKKLIISLLKNIEYGTITIKDLDGITNYGATTNIGPHAELEISSCKFYQTLFWHGGLGLAETYILGLWQSKDLTCFLQILARNLATVNKADNSVTGAVSRLISNISHFIKKNNINGSRKNISRHYDLGNNFFELFLDAELMYSSAIYDQPDFSLEQASRHKLHTICTKLELKPSDHLLEIGTGWGGLACYAAKNYGCRVTTTTISEQQYIFAVQKVNKLGLVDQIQVIKQDYRQLSGQYDKLVSIEMIEAVGHHYFANYFQQCSNLIKDNGLFVLQAITIADQRYISARDSVDFIKKHIFPGCCIPSLAEIMRNIENHTNYNLLNIQDITLDYAKTLRDWRQRFQQQLDKISSYGFDELFIRKWIYYFCYCEAGFLERTIFDLQIVFSKPGYRPKDYANY